MKKYNIIEAIKLPIGTEFIVNGNEEENEQHKRNIGRRRCIQLRYTTPAMMEIHHNFRLYFVAP